MNTITFAGTIQPLLDLAALDAGRLISDAVGMRSTQKFFFRSMP
jgi:hypothetical protein